MIPIQFWQALPYLEAFTLALAIPVAVATQYRVGRQVRPDVRLMVLFAVTAFGAMLTVLLTPRDLNERTLVPEARRLLADFDDGFAASRYLNFFLVSFSAAELLRGWLSLRGKADADPARHILFGLSGFYVGTILIQALGSAHPSFSYKALYVPVIMLAVYHQRVDNIGQVLGFVKLTIFVLTAGSLAAMAIRPDFVLHRPEPGVLPGIDFRMFGLAPHANALGPMALIALLLQLHTPTRWRALRALEVGAAVAVLVLAQSKTAWVAGLVIIAMVGLPLGLMPSRDPAKKARHFQRSVATALAFIAVLIAAATVLAMSDVIGHVEQTANVDTLTGRTQIWQLTLEGWHESLLFGYGRDIWGPERMLKFGMLHVGQAHNQFVQTLGDSGLLGLLALLCLLGALLHAALQSFSASRGLTLSLWIVVTARCVTEAPLRADGVLTWPTFTLALLVTTACHFVRTEAKAAPSPASVQGWAPLPLPLSQRAAGPA